MTGSLQDVAVKRPHDALADGGKIDREWSSSGWEKPPDLEAAVQEHDAFVELIKSFETRVHYVPRDPSVGIDSIYVHDPVVITNRGAILCNMGKRSRHGEAAVLGRFLQSLEIPIIGEIEAPGSLEGGDVCWLGERTVVVGRGYRSNQSGIDQLRRILGDEVDEVIPVDLPHWTGPADCLHLLSLISPLDEDLAIVHSRLMAVAFRQLLERRGLRFVEVDPEEYRNLACNVLAMAPRKAIMIEGNPRTQRSLEKEGVDVATFEAREIGLKGQGGPTCLTRPLNRG